MRSDSDLEFDEFEDEEEEEIFGLFDFVHEKEFKYFVAVTILFLTLISLVWLFYRDSRPESVDALLASLDESLESQQTFVDSLVNSFKKLAGLPVASRLNKRPLTRTAGKPSLTGWTTVCNGLSLTVAAKQDILEQKRAELAELREKRNNLLLNGPIKGLNDQIREAIDAIRRSNYDSVNKVDESIRKAHRILYNTAIVKAFREDLQRRSKIIQNVKTRIGTVRNDTLIYARPINKFLQVAAPKVCKTKQLRIVGNLQDEPTIPEDWFKNLNTEIPLTKLEMVNSNKVQLVQMEESLLGAQQTIEEDLFALETGQDLNYYDRVKGSFTQIRVYSEFLGEFSKFPGGQFDILKERLRAHVNKQKDRIARLKKVQNTREMAMNFLEIFHKHAMLKFFTAPKRTFVDKIGLLEREAQLAYAEKFTGWFDETLRMGKAFKNAKEINSYMFRALSDRDGNSFNMERAISLILHLVRRITNTELLGKWNDIEFHFFTDSAVALIPDVVVFAMAAYFNYASRLTEKKFNSINFNREKRINCLSDHSRPLLEEVKRAVLK